MLDLFVLYYVAWHEKEFSLSEMRANLLADLGVDGFAQALQEFRSQRSERELKGEFRTLFQIMKS